MPCYLTGSAEGDRAYFAEEERVKLEKKLQKLNRMLCAACNLLRQHDLINYAPKELQSWNKAHRKVDGK